MAAQKPYSTKPTVMQMTATAVLITTVVVAAAAALVFASEIFLILFLGLIFAAFLSLVSRWVSRVVGLNQNVCFALVVGLFLIATGSLAGFGLIVLSNQIDRAEEHLQASRKIVDDYSMRFPPVRSAIASTPFLRNLIPMQDISADSNGARERQVESGSQSTGDVSKSTPSGQKASIIKEKVASSLSSAAGSVVRAVAEIFRTTFGVLVNSALIFFVGIFIAVSPSKYGDGVVRLFLPVHRDRMNDVLYQLASTLQHWLIGRFAAMIVTGLGAGVVLVAFGVPMGLSLGLVTGVLTFVPNIGSLIAFCLAVLFALPQGGAVVLGVIIGFLVLQVIESYVITPLIQQKQVSLPPALLIATQAVMGVLFGFLGAAVASPLLAVVKKAVEELYIKDTLEAPSVSGQDCAEG